MVCILDLYFQFGMEFALKRPIIFKVFPAEIFSNKQFTLVTIVLWMLQASDPETKVNKNWVVLHVDGTAAI